MKKYLVTVKDIKSGATIMKKESNVFIAGTADGADADVIFIPCDSEESVEALIDACEEAVASVLGYSEDESFCDEKSEEI